MDTTGADLAATTVPADGGQVRWAGPVTLQPTFPFVAYAVGGLAGLPTLCFTAHLDDHHALLERLQDLLQASVGHMTRELTHWRELQCLVVRVHEGARRVSFEAVSGPPLYPEATALAALRSLKAVFVRDIGGVRCIVEQLAPEGDEIRCRHDFWAEDAPQRRGHVYLEDDPDHEQLDKALQGFVAATRQSDVIDEIDRGMFMQEAASATDPLTAFRAFSHAVVLSPEASHASELLVLGLRVWRMLSAALMPDYAEWVAGKLVELAPRTGPPGVRIEMLRLHGISLSQLGLAAGSLACFEQADSLLAQSEARSMEAQLRMSHALAITDLSMHWETLAAQTRLRCAAEMAGRLEVAQRQLLAARELLAASTHERAPRNLVFTQLELLRLRDLRGDPAGALSALDTMPAASQDLRAYPGLSDIDRSKHEATLVHYRLCAVLKLYEAELETATADAPAAGSPAALRLFRDEIPRALGQLRALPHGEHILDRQCAVAVLVSKVYLEVALALHARPAAAADDGATLRSLLPELESTRLNLQTALALRRRIESHDVRPARAGIEYGGLPAIDIAGMLQHCLLLLAELKNDPALVWRSFSLADETKGRFFKRDLAFTRPLPSGGAAGPGPSTSRALQRALVRGEVDHRLLMADLEWSLQHDLAPAEADALRKATAFEEGIGPDEIRSLLEADTTPTAVLAFYATAQESIVYGVSSADRVPRVARLVVDVAGLEDTLRQLQAAVAGALHGAAAPEPPEALRGLQRLLLPLLDGLEGIERLVIVPHGPWHGVPVHAWLLPELWKSGREAAVVYVPSLRSMHLLRQRREAGRAAQRTAIGVATVPAREDPLAPFEREHQSLLSLLRETGRPVEALFGAEATPQRVLGSSGAVGIRHLLAHGIDMGVDQAMRSGLLLADGAGLPSRHGDPSAQAMLMAMHELAHGTAAGHVTLQACGLGHQHGAHRDELWGMVRALIAGGANSVLAPMWAVGLGASTALLLDFYRRWLIEGVAPELALARAQRCLAEQPEGAYRHLAHWAAFQYVGV